MVKRILILLFQISLFHCHIVLADGPKNYPEGKFYSSVKNHFLIATDKMKDEKFEKSVIVMLESSEEGAWGLAINKLLGEIPIALLIDPSLNTSNEREKLFKKKINSTIFNGFKILFKSSFQYFNIRSSKQIMNLSREISFLILLTISVGQNLTIKPIFHSSYLFLK